MSIYHKKLKSRVDLKQERERLKGQLAKLEAEPLPELDIIDTIRGAVTGNGKKTEGFDLLSAVMPLMGNVPDLLKSVLNGRGGAAGKAVIGFLQRKGLPIVKEILIGYGKWKALEFSVKTARGLFGKKKKKAAKTE